MQPAHCVYCGNSELKYEQTPLGMGWLCSRCNAIAVQRNELSQHTQKSTLDFLWEVLQKEEFHGEKCCPICHKPVVSFQLNSQIISRDAGACVSCQFFYFPKDVVPVFAQEFGFSPPDDHISPSHQLALAEMEMITERSRNTYFATLRFCLKSAGKLFWHLWCSCAFR